jgi:hypothetical protein
MTAAHPSRFPKGVYTVGSILLMNSLFLLSSGSFRLQASQATHQIEEVMASSIDNDNFSLARKHSFGFFDDITNDNWRRLQTMVAEHWNHKYPEKPLTHHPAWEKGYGKWQNSHPAWYQTNFEPNFSCQFEMRVGATGTVSRGNGDGPKWVCDPHRIKRLAAERKAKDPTHPGCVIYSIGSAGDFSYEKGMEEILGPGTCEYHIFDMGDFERTMKAQNISRAYFHRWGLMKQGNVENTQPGAEFYGMKDTVKLLGHENLDVIDVFKIDCEKCEWRTYRDWLLPGLPSLQQIQVEIHSGDLYKFRDADDHHHDITPEIPFFEFLEEAGYVRYHKEPNIQYNDGSCEEYAFLKLDKEFFEPRKKVLAERNITRVDI